MTDQELLQAIGQVVEAKLEPVRQDIRELKEGVQRLETRMDKLETRMDKLEIRMDQLEARMDQLETRMDKLEIRIDQLETRIDKLEARTDKLEEQVQGIRVYMETDQQRTLNLLLEGQQALWDRFVPHEKFDPLEDRTEVLELTVKRHSQEIRELQLA